MIHVGLFFRDINVAVKMQKLMIILFGGKKKMVLNAVLIRKIFVGQKR